MSSAGTTQSVALIGYIGLNDKDLLPHFFAYYRQLGVSDFVLALHGDWPAQLVAQLDGQADIQIAERSTGQFKEADKEATLSNLLGRFCNQWVLLADADEFVQLPYPSLSETIDALDALGSRCLPALLVQRLSRDGELLSVSDDSDLNALFPMWDYWLSEHMGCERPIWKTSFPLVYVSPGSKVYAGNHFPANGTSTTHKPIRAIVHHFKWRAALLASLASTRARDANQHEQAAYQSWLNRHNNRLPTDWAKDFDSQQLRDLGIFIAPRQSELPPISSVSSVPVSEKRRIALVSSQIVGPNKSGGVATAVSALAELLVDAGHDVHLVFCPFKKHNELWSGWFDYWQSRGVTLHYHPQGTRRREGARAYRRFRSELTDILDELHCDLLHFTDGDAYGVNVVLLRYAGLRFSKTAVITTMHGCNVWHRRGNALGWNQSEAMNHSGLIDLYRLSDLAIFPSEYMQQWTREHLGDGTPAQRVVPNCPTGLTRSFGQTQTERKVDEIVFFGRLEQSKGLSRFTAALQILGNTEREYRLTFLGMFGQNIFAEQIFEELSGLTCKIQFLTNYDNVEAVNYLKTNNVLAVVPSRSDNSPYTVYECLEAGVPLMTSSVGGIPELIHSDDHAHIMVADSAEQLATAMGAVLEKGVARTGRLSFDPGSAESTQVTLHENLSSRAIFRRAASDKLAMAPVIRIEFGENKWTPQAIARINRKIFEFQSSDSILLFYHADVSITEESGNALRNLLRNGGFDAVVCDYQIQRSDGKRSHPLYASAAPAEHSASRNLYGAPCFAITREAFLANKGFDTSNTQSQWAHWLLLNALLASGGRIGSLPETLCHWRLENSSQLSWQNDQSLREALIAPWLTRRNSADEAWLRKAASDFGDCPETRVAKRFLVATTPYSKMLVKAESAIAHVADKVKKKFWRV